MTMSAVQGVLFHERPVMLSPSEQNVLQTLKTLLTLERKSTFSSDDLRRFQLDRFFMDKQHGIGIFFFKLIKLGLVEKVGRTRSTFASNHMREIRVYKFTGEST